MNSAQGALLGKRSLQHRRWAIANRRKFPKHWLLLLPRPTELFLNLLLLLVAVQMRKTSFAVNPCSSLWMKPLA